LKICSAVSESWVVFYPLATATATATATALLPALYADFQ
jgi:hypothetical protein